MNPGMFLYFLLLSNVCSSTFKCMASFCVFLHSKKKVWIFIIIVFFLQQYIKSCCAIQTLSPHDAEYISVPNMNMQNVILEALITFWIQSTPQKLFKCFQESRKSYNCSTSTKSLLLWNQENEYSIFFSIWVPWHTIDSLYFPNNFWQISQCGLLMCFDIHFVTAFEKHIKLAQKNATCSLELQTSEQTLGITVFTATGVGNGLSASNLMSINWWQKVLKM